MASDFYDPQFLGYSLNEFMEHGGEMLEEEIQVEPMQSVTDWQSLYN